MSLLKSMSGDCNLNRDLQAEVHDGKFREDLFYRLNVIHIQLPPLRERKNDIEELVNHFITKFNNEMVIVLKAWKMVVWSF